MKDTGYQCPSSKCKEGSDLLGIINDKGLVDILEHPLPVTKDFIEIAKKGRSPEQRFRFTNKCVEGGCAQWTGSRCAVIDKVLLELNELASLNGLPLCEIRPRCRWYNQSGPEACRLCPYVHTEAEEKIVS